MLSVEPKAVEEQIAGLGKFFAVAVPKRKDDSSPQTAAEIALERFAKIPASESTKRDAVDALISVAISTFFVATEAATPENEIEGCMNVLTSLAVKLNVIQPLRSALSSDSATRPVLRLKM